MKTKDVFFFLMLLPGAKRKIKRKKKTKEENLTGVVSPPEGFQFCFYDYRYYLKGFLSSI